MCLRNCSWRDERDRQTDRGGQRERDRDGGSEDLGSWNYGYFADGQTDKKSRQQTTHIETETDYGTTCSWSALFLKVFPSVSPKSIILKANKADVRILLHGCCTQCGVKTA